MGGEGLTLHKVANICRFRLYHYLTAVIRIHVSRAIVARRPLPWHIRVDKGDLLHRSLGWNVSLLCRLNHHLICCCFKFWLLLGISYNILRDIWEGNVQVLLLFLTQYWFKIGKALYDWLPKTRHIWSRNALLFKFLLLLGFESDGSSHFGHAFWFPSALCVHFLLQQQQVACFLSVTSFQLIRIFYQIRRHPNWTWHRAFIVLNIGKLGSSGDVYLERLDFLIWYQKRFGNKFWASLAGPAVLRIFLPIAAINTIVEGSQILVKLRGQIIAMFPLRSRVVTSVVLHSLWPKK